MKTVLCTGVRDCAIIIRRGWGGGAKNEPRKEKYYTIPPLSTKAN